MTDVEQPGFAASGAGGGRLRVGTRGSTLALAQAAEVIARIASRGGPPCDTVVIRTSGDASTRGSAGTPIAKRLFVKELEDALLAGAIDLAVHSCKDLPVTLPAGLELAAVLPRRTPWDALVLPAPVPLAPGAAAPLEVTTTKEPPAWLSASVDAATAALRVIAGSPRVGTGSLRRTVELSRWLPTARFLPIRGNIDTRLRKLDAGEYDVLVLAAAGLERLGSAGRIACVLPVEMSVPSAGQGAIAIEARAGDARVTRLAASIGDGPTLAAISAERAVVAVLGGGCRTPIGAVALPIRDGLELHAAVLSPDGRRAARGVERGPADRAVEIGKRLARRLVADGADDMLDDVKRMLP